MSTGEFILASFLFIKFKIVNSFLIQATIATFAGFSLARSRELERLKLTVPTRRHADRPASTMDSSLAILGASVLGDWCDFGKLGDFALVKIAKLG